MRKCLLYLGVLRWFIALSQEFYAEVKVKAPSIKTTNQAVFTELQEQLRLLINNTSWTEVAFRGHERIPATFILEITKMEGANFEGILHINISRPVLYSTYLSPLFVHQDQSVTFTYTQYQPLEYVEGTYDNELVAVVAYYVYVSLGLYWDSFGKLAGTPFYQKARAIVQQGMVRGGKGWSMDDLKRRNRYWLIESLLEPRHRPVREVIYSYHRRGMDRFYEDPENGRLTVLSALRQLEQHLQEFPRAYPVVLFIRAKREEIIDVFSEAPTSEKTEVLELMGTLDPSRVDVYRRSFK